MHEDLLNAVSALVHRHVLRELHNMTGALLAQLDVAGETDLGGRAATREAAKPALAAQSLKPSTLERKQRLLRQKRRQAVAAAPAGETAAPAGHWPVLRAEFHAAIRARRLSGAEVAADLRVSNGSICGWLVPNGAPPSAANIAKIRAWLSSAPKPAPADWPAVREQLRAVIRDRGLTHAELGRVFEVEGATVGTWLAPSHEKRMPGARFLLRIEQWPREGAVMPASAAADAPPFVLSVEERAQIVGHLSLAGNGRELRETFGCTRELLEQAASGAHLDAEVISRLRGVLANGAAE